MKRIIFGIAVFGVFSLATAMLSSKPVQAAGFGLTANYKYLIGIGFGAGRGGDNQIAMGHGAQVDFLWSLSPLGSVTKVPGIALGFDVAGGGLAGERSGGFYKVAFLTEFNRGSGLGFTFGVGGAHFIVREEADVWGLGFTDLGIRYSTKKDLIFSVSGDIMTDPRAFASLSQDVSDSLDNASSSSTSSSSSSSSSSSNPSTIITGVTVGVGYRF